MSVNVELKRLSEMDYYARLGLEFGASDIEIKKAYRSLMMLCHPDRNKGKEEIAGEISRLINEANDCLSNSEKRAKYDAELSRHSGVANEDSNSFSNAEIDDFVAYLSSLGITNAESLFELLEINISETEIRKAGFVSVDEFFKKMNRVGFKDILSVLGISSVQKLIEFKEKNAVKNMENALAAFLSSEPVMDVVEKVVSDLVVEGVCSLFANPGRKGGRH